MTWFPMGPDFVYAPRDSAAPERLSRRNEYARQALVRDIAVDPSNSANLYTVELPSFGGGSVHRSTDGGKTWTSLADSLLQADPTVSPTCIAVHPSNGNYLYLGSASGAVYVSNNAGQSWSAPQMLGSQIVRIIVDRETRPTPPSPSFMPRPSRMAFFARLTAAAHGARPHSPAISRGSRFPFPW